MPADDDRLRGLELTVQELLVQVENLSAARLEARTRWSRYVVAPQDRSDEEGKLVVKLDWKSADDTRDQIEPLRLFFFECALAYPRMFGPLRARLEDFFQHPDRVWPYGPGDVRTSDNNDWADEFLVLVRGLLDEAREVIIASGREIPTEPQTGERGVLEQVPARQGQLEALVPGVDRRKAVEAFLFRCREDTSTADRGVRCR